VLAGQPTVVDVVRTLVLWGHPFGAPLVPAVTGAHPSLFDVELALERAFASRALSRAHRGGRHLMEYTQQVVDVMNAWSALLHFVERDPAIVDIAFIEGGRWLNRDDFQKILSSDSRAELQRALARTFRPSPIASAFIGETETVTSLEAEVLRAQIEWQNRVALTDPGSSAPLIGFALELRAELLNLRRIIWGVALSAPAALVEAEMVAV
jgi:vacuolar-type H+-ATPase subunit C/Vma6